MKPKTKLALKRWTIRKLRLLFDFLEDRLHTAEVSLRSEIAGTTPTASGNTLPAMLPGAATPAAHKNSFTEWEARCSGVAVISKKQARRTRTGAVAFDQRFAHAKGV